MHHCVLHRKKRGYQGTNEKFSIVGLCKAIWDGKWALATPAIILGGIYAGIFTPTEAAVVAAVRRPVRLPQADVEEHFLGAYPYLGLCRFRHHPCRRFDGFLAAAHLVPYPPDRGRVPRFHLHGPDDHPAAHCILHLPVRLRGRHAGDGRGARAGVPAHHEPLGIHPIQLGILFVVCCETGFLTPPFGANLFITMKITDVKLEEGR